jgi:SAM-dependent methyltransferase
MPDDPRDIVESGYDAIADRYAEAIRAGRGPETYFRSFLARVLELIPEGGTVLDLGCGAGLVTADLTTRARVVGVDISLAQLELARRNAPAARFVRADMVDVAFAPGSFDAVVAFWTLIHVPRVFHASLLEGVHMWLRSGGLFAGTLGKRQPRQPRGGLPRRPDVLEPFRRREQPAPAPRSRLRRPAGRRDRGRG